MLYPGSAYANMILYVIRHHRSDYTKIPIFVMIIFETVLYTA